MTLRLCSTSGKCYPSEIFRRNENHPLENVRSSSNRHISQLSIIYYFVGLRRQPQIGKYLIFTEMHLTRAGRGGLLFGLPNRFFADNEKTTARTVFGTPFHTSFSHLVQKIQPQVFQGQVTRSGQVTSCSKKSQLAPQLQLMRDQFQYFSD